MTPRQYEMLKSFAADSEATDYSAFRAAPASLAWINRERVIDACIRKGWLTKECTLTEAGHAALKARAS